MRSSDTPENELERQLGHRRLRAPDVVESDAELRGPQGPVDWSRETPSDDRLSPATRHRLEQLALEGEPEEQLVGEP